MRLESHGLFLNLQRYPHPLEELLWLIQGEFFHHTTMHVIALMILVALALSVAKQHIVLQNLRGRHKCQYGEGSFDSQQKHRHNPQNDRVQMEWAHARNKAQNHVDLLRFLLHSD